MKKPIDKTLIDKAYDFCREMWKDEESFKKYWEDNYVKFIEDFSEHKFRSSMKINRSTEQSPSEATEHGGGK